MFKYSVDADSLEDARYICHLLRSHGLMYEWDCGTWPFNAKGVRVSIQSNVSGNSTRAALILTRDASLLHDCGFLTATDSKANVRWVYCFPGPICDGTPPEAIPVAAAWTTSFDAPADSSQILTMASEEVPLRCIGA